MNVVLAGIPKGYTSPLLQEKHRDFEKSIITAPNDEGKTASRSHSRQDLNTNTMPPSCR
jgi:hypothetical protein